jgi:hypothetical protein
MTDGFTKYEPTEEFLNEQLDSTLSWLNNKGIRAIIISPTPYIYPKDIGSCTRKAIWRGASPSICNYFIAATAPKYLSFMNYANAKFDSNMFFDLSSLTCPDGQCATMYGDAILYRDWGHLSINGGIEIGKSKEFRVFLESNIVDN